jgi:hypothetical protein
MSMRKDKICPVCLLRLPRITSLEHTLGVEVTGCIKDQDITCEEFCDLYLNWDTGLPGKPGSYPYSGRIL